jgi:hypothetical protein
MEKGWKTLLSSDKYVGPCQPEVFGDNPVSKKI